MPGYQTIYDWMDRDEDFKRDLNAARQIYYERMSDEIVEISDENKNDFKKVIRNGKEEWIPDWEAIKRSELRVQTRKWILGRVMRKKWGDGDEEKSKALTESVLDIIKIVAGLARKPVKTELLDQGTPLLEDKTSSVPDGQK